MNKEIIHVCGNPSVKGDSMPLKLKKILEKRFPEICFIDYDPTEEMHTMEKIILLDCVANLENSRLISNPEILMAPPRNTVHDYDLYWELKLRLKTEKLKKVTIIGVPQKGKTAKIAKDVSKIISSLR